MNRRKVRPLGFGRGARDGTDARDQGREEQLRVSTIELFFDLVFVFMLTQLTTFLEHELTLEAGFQVVLIFVVLFWMYGGYAWLTNQVPAESATRRLLLIGGMAAFLICALSVPHAFRASGVEFGIGYLLVVVVHAGLYAVTYGRSVLRFVPLNIAGALAVIGAGFIEHRAAYALWLLPIVFQYVASKLVRGVEELGRAGFDIRSDHFVERHGLLLIVAFGESVVAVGIGIGDMALDIATLATAVLGLGLVSALWWAYFDEGAGRAEAVLREASINDRTRLALNAYFYAYIPMLLGIVAVAAGVGFVIGDVGGTVGFGAALLLGGGVALYLANNVAFRAALRIGPVATRAGAGVAAVATLPLGTFVAAPAQIVGLAIVLIAMLAFDSGRGTRGEEESP